AGSLRKNTGSIGKLARPGLITFYLKGKHPPVAGIVYGFHLRMRSEESGQTAGIFVVPAHTVRQGFDSPNGKVAIKRRKDGSRKFLHLADTLPESVFFPGNECATER